MVDQRTNDAGDVAERGGGIAVASLVERGRERFGPRLPARDLGVGPARGGVGRLLGLGGACPRVACGDGRVTPCREERGDAFVGGVELLLFAGERVDPTGRALEPGGHPVELRIDAGERVAARLELALGHAQRVGIGVGQRALGERALRRREVVLGALDRGALLRERRAHRARLVELAAHLGGVGHERLEHAFVGHRRQLALEPSALLVEECGEAGDARPQ